MATKAMMRTPKDTPTAAPVLIPSLDSEEGLFVELEEESATEVEEGSVDVEEVFVDDSEDIDGLAVTVSVTLSVHVCPSFADSVAVTVTTLGELTLAALER